ncbi:hypothetical protein Tco_0015547 [Tanacetum coccineum]
MRTKLGVDSLSFDDLYNNLRVFENDVKGSTASSSSTHNVAFVSENTNSTNDVSTAYGVSNPSGHNSHYEQTLSYSLLENQSSSGHDFNENEKVLQKDWRRDAWNSGNKDGRRSGKQEDSKALVTIDGEDCSVETHEPLPEPTVNEPNVVCQPKVWSDAPIIEEYESDSKDEHVSLPTEEQETPSFANKQVKTPRETIKNRFTHSKGLGYGFTIKACFLVLLREKGKLLLSPQQVVIGDPKDITGTKSPNTIVDQDYPHRALQNKGIVDSGCSRHMTGNKAYLAEY